MDILWQFFVPSLPCAHPCASTVPSTEVKEPIKKDL
jgi:hypothetical protein